MRAHRTDGFSRAAPILRSSLSITDQVRARQPVRVSDNIVTDELVGVNTDNISAVVLARSHQLRRCLMTLNRAVQLFQRRWPSAGRMSWPVSRTKSYRPSTLRVSVRKLSDQRRSLPTSVGACYRISSWCAPSVPRRRSSCSRDRDNSTPSRSGLRGTGPDGLERHATATLCANLERNRDLAGQAVPDPYDNYVALYNKRYRELCLISRNFCASHTDFTTELPEGDDLGETP
jgi:hypothetical protein